MSRMSMSPAELAYASCRQVKGNRNSIAPMDNSRTDDLEQCVLAVREMSDPEVIEAAEMEGIITESPEDARDQLEGKLYQESIEISRNIGEPSLEDIKDMMGIGDLESNSEPDLLIEFRDAIEA